MSALPEPAPREPRPRAVGAETVVRARMSPRERLARIIRYHELLVGMVRKELKIKYKNSVLGFLWSLLNPISQVIVFTVVFQVVLRNSVPYFPICPGGVESAPWRGDTCRACCAVGR